MTFKDLADVLSVNVKFDISDRLNSTILDFATYIEDTSYFYKYANREIEIIMPYSAEKLLICLK